MKTKAYAIRDTKIVCELGIPSGVNSDNKHDWIMNTMKIMKYDYIIFITDEDFKRLFF
jgi:hypothetical protein